MKVGTLPARILRPCMRRVGTHPLVDVVASRVAVEAVMDTEVAHRTSALAVVGAVKRHSYIMFDP